MATVAGPVIADGHVVVEGNRIVSIGEGPGDGPALGGPGFLITPGLINCHHHLYQWATRGFAQQATLFEWLVELYPTWARIDERVERVAARAGLAALLRSGCTTASDHHYVFPGGDLLGVEVAAARELGIRFHPCRGAMDLGASQGGLPPDSVVEDRDAIFAAYEDALHRFHDPSPGAMCRIALAPCSPFSVTRELMAETAAFARERGVRLHTHMAETVEEEAFCLELFGCRPVEYLEDLGWLGDDVWLAHCVHLSDDEVTLFGATRTGVAHCPSSNARLGAGMAPVVPLVRAGAPVGLGVDGAASNEAGELGGELRQALLVARLRGGPAAMTCAEALELGTLHGARCLGREDELGTLEAGKLADIVVWRLDDLDHAGIEDPVAALVLGARPLADTVIVDGKIVVEGGELKTGDVEEISHELAEVRL
ncbi:8-oxoguanine deaminase [Solirubrobacter soli]|uniref:8-oxoguanine deaminase n=1 Tax=Solirubrobacter soli TaxID=363832 RepID=UPI0004194810|nr:8-oxoguanine deaminase [Solirubrobacter soli]